MVYFPPEIFGLILEYNNESFKRDHNDKMKNIVVYFAMKNYINTTMWYHLHSGNMKLPYFMLHFKDFIVESNQDKSIRGLINLECIPQTDCKYYKILSHLYFREELKEYIIEKRMLRFLEMIGF